MELAVILTALSSAALAGPWLVAVAGARRAASSTDADGGGTPPGTRDDYTLAV